MSPPSVCILFRLSTVSHPCPLSVPSLGLHSAAATGNVGLVEYALNNGQPINSVLDGVLPLHAACAGGNVQVVKLLIEHGADVNAPRLPRKYSNDKNRDSSAPIVGTSGSTPLHFAAANGNTEVVSLLLLHGAHADRPDKHGVTPEMLAHENGWVECAKVLREWITNKDRDLREREGILGRTNPSNAGQAYPDPQPSTSRKRLHVKQSIDTALNLLKAPDCGPKGAQPSQTSTPPASPIKPPGEYTFYPTNDSPVEHSSRRPSLPHVLPDASPRNRQTSTTSAAELPKQRRPRSAGTGADRSQEQEQNHPVYGRGGSGRRLGSKYSLLNIFKKGQPGDGTDGPTENASIVDVSGPPPSVATPGSLAALSSQTAPGQSGQASVVDLTQPSSFSSAPARLSSKHRGSDASTRSGSRLISSQSVTSNPPPLPRKPSGNLRTPPRPSAPLAVELHLALAQQQQQQRNQSNVTPNDFPSEDGDKYKLASPPARFNALFSGHNRHRSSSATSMPVESRTSQDDGSIPPSFGAPDEGGKPSPSPRPGILRAHNRSPSVGQGGSPIPRTLRFDSSSSNQDSERKARDSPRSVPSQLRSYNSAGSLTKLNIETTAKSENGSPVSDIGIEAPSRDEVAVDEDENYGQPIVSDHLVGIPNLPSVLLQRQRGQSFTSSSDSSLSPILSNDNINDQTSSVLDADFPFSINRAPPDEQVSEATSSPAYLNVPGPSDTRNRGDSLSSDSTSDSRSNMPMSLSNTSGSGTSVTIVSPGLSDNLVLPSDPYKREPVISVSELPNEPAKKPVPPPLPIHNLNERRAHSPLDIDLSTISSHAQAEALVERARQEALEMASAQEIGALPASLGRSPLSARLAAYGESLALEKKLREQKEAESAWRDRERDAMSIQVSNGPTPLPRQKSREGVERQLSLENRTGSARAKRRIKDPRRPSTADGPSSTTTDAFFAPRTPSHQSTRSTSTSNHSIMPFRDQTENRYPSPRLNYVPLDGTTTADASPLGTSRARTPLIQPDESLSRIQSGDDPETETDSSTALHSMVVAPPASNTREKQVRTAKKLTKMGIAVADQAAAASRVTPAPSTPPTKRFGLKSFMQTFKGKA
ncbi:hypothetical protein CPB84DRAFT_1837133 [Gymnopilus junonius]|uniref:Ankyrin n=1 Tax=Gymnopilus junonius TaxID=109634 RepID=A0A9P5NKF8_GYMJU|nr:hypothetical protein CPB84DRAFT_1837133 [Gymnopilus junonius]